MGSNIPKFNNNVYILTIQYRGDYIKRAYIYNFHALC